MKKLIVSAFALAAVVLSANAQTQSVGTQVGTGKAELVSPITVSTLAAGGVAGTLEFGRINIGATQKTVTITPVINAATQTDFDLIDAGNATVATGATKATAGFQISGVKGQTVYISLPPTASLANTIDAQAPNLTVSSFKTSLTDNKGDLDSSTGLLNFFVGGTLTIPETAFAGTYAGTYTVTVDYN